MQVKSKILMSVLSIWLVCCVSFTITNPAVANDDDEFTLTPVPIEAGTTVHETFTCFDELGYGDLSGMISVCNVTTHQLEDCEFMLKNQPMDCSPMWFNSRWFWGIMGAVLTASFAVVLN